MIKKILLPLIAVILFSSCSNKFSLQKRKYTKGFYFANSKNNNQKEHSIAANTKQIKKADLKTTSQSIKDVSVVEKKCEENSLPVSKGDVVFNSNKADVKSNKNLTAHSAKNIVAQEKEFKELILSRNKNKVSELKKGDSNANLIVLVILSLFPILALIAMYIHDGHKITTNFWVDLILHLTIIGYIIFALLVVLDVVDLS